MSCCRIWRAPSSGSCPSIVMCDPRRDRELILGAVKQALSFAADELRGDHDVVLAAAKQDVRTLQLAAPWLQEQLRKLRGGRLSLEEGLALACERGPEYRDNC
mmetsp:Transcript_84828/g.216057  ORF Transcript_84828/g.216057 Transcript_84828/m.216057 type:complete len:103 (+) Transcript_84828:89-397(+)